MKNKFLVLFFALIAIIFARCANEPRNAAGNGVPGSSADSALAAEEYIIQINKDTVLHTPKGALIKIPAGALNAKGAATVKLVVKEAFSMADIVKGRLLTKNGNLLLSSGGMIYINAADKNVTIAKPLSVSIPTDHLQKGMQLYKGNIKNDSTIDWVDPQPLPEQHLSPELNKGKMLFTKNCQSCHEPLKDAKGPALAFLDKRRDKKWLEAFVHNSANLVRGELVKYDRKDTEGDTAKLSLNPDAFAQCLFCKWNSAPMPAFPKMNNEEIADIFAYADYEAQNTDPATILDIKLSCDSCRLYDSLRIALETKRTQLKIDNGLQVIYKDSPKVAGPRVAKIIVPGPPNQVVVPVREATYYQFEVNTFGWYNVDVIVSIPDGDNANILKQSELLVTLTGSHTKEVNVFLVVPAEKMFVPGGRAVTGENDYAFLANDGKIPLWQNMPAYILVMGEEQGQVFFGKKAFTTSLTQHLYVQPELMTKEQMNAEIDKLGLDNLSVKGKDSKNADSIRKIDIELDKIETLKAKNVNCHCGWK